MTCLRVLLLLSLLVATSLGNEPPKKKPDGNRLAYLDEPLNPYYPHKDFPKLITPQWVGEEGVECVVTLGIDDMRDPKKYEAYLRPILDRLKKIDGRVPVSIMTCQVKPDDPQLQAWLEEGLSIECHTYDHPCPCLKEGSLAKAKETYDKCVDLISQIPGNKPVAFRMPCCDSLNTPSPRFWAEVFNKTTAKGNFLQIDSSVFNIITGKDESLPKEIRFNDAGEERFRRYVPFKDFVNTIEDYPYPYIIGRMCWEFPCVVPSDWSAQHVQKPNNPDTVRDWKLALDAIVLKQGVFNLVFHPHNWIRPEQVVELIDYADKKYGKKVKFLTFGECAERLNNNLVLGDPVNRLSKDLRYLDVNNDGYLDYLYSDDRAVSYGMQWSADKRKFERISFPCVPFDPNENEISGNVTFGLLTRNGSADAITSHTGGLMGWKVGKPPAQLSQKHFSTRTPARIIALDLDGDGLSEVIDITSGTVGVPNKRDKPGDGWRATSIKLPGKPLKYQSSDLRFIDINGDNKLDCLFSNSERYSLHLFKDMQEGWSLKVIDGVRGQEGGMGPEIPPFVRADGTNNGAFFHSQALWIINEDTARLPNHAFKLTFEQMLK